MDDRQLLQEFVATRCGQAFNGLVRTHVDLVYSAARRQVGGDAALAEDVTQAVFVLLAEKARTIRETEALAGWLLVTTRFVALNAMRSESRRRRYEREAAEMKREMRSDEPPGWEAIGPMLDDAVAKLKRDDRDALVLRYFEGRSAGEVAQLLGISQEAAQKRVSRAVERLRAFFQSRGIQASPQGLVGILAANACVAAPALLAAKISADALTTAAIAASTATATGSSMAVTKGTVAVMAAAKAKLAAAAAAGALLVGVTGTIAYQQLTGPANKPRQVQIAPATPVGNDWKARFESIYRLAPGETMKRVLPPFIPERMEFYRAATGETQLRAAPEGPDRYVLEDDGNSIYWQLASYGDKGTVQSVLETVARLSPQDLDVPGQLLGLPMHGDWVRRSGATEAQLAAAVSPAISQAIGRPVMLTETQVNREAIVVRGTFKHRPIQGADAKSPAKVHFYKGKLGTDDDMESGGGPPQNLLDQLADITRRPVVIETTLNDTELVSWSTHQSAYEGRQGLSSEAAIDEILDVVMKQTSLDLRREPRTVPTWSLTPAGAPGVSSAPAK